MAQVNVGYPFPPIPPQWSPEERKFAQGLRRLFDQLFWQKPDLKQIYPVGVVVLTGENTEPFSFGTWTAVTTGITGVYGWKRTR